MDKIERKISVLSDMDVLKIYKQSYFETPKFLKLTLLLYQSLLATIMGRHPEPIQKNGDLGILFLQISSSRLPIWAFISWLPSTLWWRIQINSWKIIAWLVNGGAIVYYNFTDFKVETICFPSDFLAHWQRTVRQKFCP